MSFRTFIGLFFFVFQIIHCQSTIIIKYKSPNYLKNSKTQLSRLLNDSRIEKTSSHKDEKISINSFVNSFGELNSELERIVEVRFNSNIDKKLIIEKLLSDPTIEYVQDEVNYKIDYIPEDSLFHEQWGLQIVNAPAAWDLIPDNQEKIILALIDTGIDYFHPDIKNNIFKNVGEEGLDANGNNKNSNGIDDDGNGFIDDFQGWDFVNKIDVFPDETVDDFTDWDNNPMDEHGHGTYVSGVIAAEHNTFGIAGVNPNISILNIRAFDKNGNGEEDDAAAAIIYAVKMGAKVINMSWGDGIYSKVLKDVIEYAYENGVSLVSSSGNSASNEPHYPSSFSNVISVGAIQENKVLSSFSNYGSTIDLVAPGSQIITLERENSYKNVSGTSIATPFVSGAASIIASMSDFSNEEIKQILKSTSVDLGTSGWDDRYGAGLLNIEKAVSIFSPSTIKFDFPQQDYATDSNYLPIMISCLSPYFKSYEIHYGIGTNPLSWNKLSTNSENYQSYKEKVLELDISDFKDTTYTLRLLVNRVDGNTLEERINFTIDHSPAEISSFSIFPAMLNNNETIQASISTNERTSAKLYFREIASQDKFKSISMDGISPDIQFMTNNHFVILPIEEVIGGINHEFYFEVTNLAGFKTVFDNEGNYFAFTNSIENEYIQSIEKEYSVPNGRIYCKPVKISGSTDQYILLNEKNTYTDLRILRFDDNSFIEETVLEKKIPITVGDFNSDGKTDILNLFVKNGFIETENNDANLGYETIFSDSSGEFWPAYAGDIDEDSKTEIIVFSSDTSIVIWEVQNDFEMIKEISLHNFIENSNNSKSIFRNNIALVENIDQDNEKEIIVVDNYGNLIIYQINGSSNYIEDKIIETQFPFESKSTIANGDFNGDGIQDISIFSKFEQDIFQTPLTFCSVVSNISNENIYLFQNMFISTSSAFTSSFDKEYEAISFEDINRNGKEDLIIFNFPNSYIFEYDENKTKLLFSKSNVNTQSIFVGDLDNNGINEIAIPNENELKFYEFINDNNFIKQPILFQAYSITSKHVYLNWNSFGNETYIYRGNTPESIELYDSVSNEEYLDTVSVNQTYSYYLRNYNAVGISNKSNIANVFSHAPAIVNGLKVESNKNIELSFTQPLNSKQINLSNFTFNDSKPPSSITFSSENSILVSASSRLPKGKNNITIHSLKDYYGSPINDTIISFEISDFSEERKLFIKNFNIIDNHNLVLNYNYNVDNITALNKSNYIFTPNNKIEDIQIYKGSKNSVLIKTKNPFGSIGKEYILRVENVFSDKNSGSFEVDKGSGSEVVLTSNSNDLSSIYVYPNPAKIYDNEFITFANIPNLVDIYIYSIEGKFIKKLSEIDGNGGVSWNLRSNQNERIGTGVYIFNAKSKDEFGKTKQEKMGKFVIIN